MPGYNNALQRPGRSAPVRGVASQQASTSSSASVANEPSQSASASASSSLPRSANHHSHSHQPQQQQQPQQYTYLSSTSNHPIGWDRPFSSGVPAPAVAVPIFRAAHATNMSSAAPNVAPRHANAALLPDSPPDTPPHSPGLAPVRLPTMVELHPLSSQQQQQRISPPRQSHSYERSFSHTAARDADISVDAIYTGQTPCDSELEDDADSDFSDDASQATLDQLTQAAQTLLLHSDPSRSKSQQQQQQHSRSHEAAVDSNRNALPIELMPATPEISPDNDVRHHAQKSAHAFLGRIFAAVPRNLSVEDAGVELVSPGWSGAVIKPGPAGSAQHASSSFSSVCSSDSSAETQRTLYVSMPAVVGSSLLREQVLAVLDAASEKLGCESVMVCLERAMRDFASVLHGLCYVGGAMVAAAAQEKGAEHVDGGQNKLPNADPVTGLQLREGLVLVAIEL